MSDRFISADKLIEAIKEEASLFENPVWYSVFLGFAELVNIAPTVEAIPIEQVARIITRITNKMPCDIVGDLCPREDGTCGESACWEYAIKEGWFGE